MCMDDRISFGSGFLFTTIMTSALGDLVMAAFLGLIGGFTGMLGKQLFVYAKERFIKKEKP